MRLGLAIAGSVLGFVGAAGAQTPGFWLTGLSAGTNSGVVNALSQTGAVAVGGNLGASFPFLSTGFSWTSASGRYDFGLLPGMPRPATGLSGDGQVVVGSLLTTMALNSRRAYRWTGSGPLQDLGLLPGQERSYATGISGDGSVVVGACEQSPQGNAFGQAYRWTESGGMQGLGYLRPNGTLSIANDISRNGAAIVGTSQSNGTGFPIEAFIWTQTGGMRALPNLPGSTSLQGFAYGVNADGSVAVGSASSATPQQYTHAVRWANGGALDLGTVAPSVGSDARAVSDDGNVIGGMSGPVAFVWTPSTGMLDLSVYLVNHGLTLPAGYTLTAVYAISGDGLTFGGRARNLTNNSYEGFVATIPSPYSILILALPAVMRRRRPAA